LAVAVACLAFSGLWHWDELSALAVGLAGALAAASCCAIGRAGYAVMLDLARLRVTAGQSALGSLTVSNPTGRPLRPSNMYLPVGRATAAFRVPRLAASALHEEAFQLPTSRRAVIQLGPVNSWRGDPFGLMRREITWTEPVELFVHPQTINLDGSSAGFLRDLEGRPSNDLSSSDVAFHALRDYVPGDDLRHIHWKTSAKLGRFMVRQFEETRRSHLVVVLSCDPADYLGADAFELAVSAAASLGLQAIREEKDLNVWAEGRELINRSGPTMLDDFSRLEFAVPGSRLVSLARLAAAATPDASTAVLVTGGLAEAATLHAAVAAFPIDTLVMVVRACPGCDVARAKIAAAPVLSLGALDQLPRGMRSMEVA
jgi:uncharacterized protein (DUF58 family)